MDNAEKHILFSCSQETHQLTEIKEHIETLREGIIRNRICITIAYIFLWNIVFLHLATRQNIHLASALALYK